jgi:hypothetical protein
MARYSRDTNSFSVSINNADAIGNANSIGNADIAGNVHVGVAHRLAKRNGFNERHRFAVECLCFPQKHGASCHSQAGGEIRGSERRLKADR